MRIRKRILLYSVVTLFLTLVIVFFVFEFRFVKQVITKNETNVTQIASGELHAYLHGLKFRTTQAAQSLGREDSFPGHPSNVWELAARYPDMMDIYVVGEEGWVSAALDDAEIGRTKPVPDPLSEVIRDGRVVALAFSAALPDGSGHLIIEYGTSDFQNEFLLKYATDTFKVGILDREGRALVWPFALDVLKDFDPLRDTLRVEDTVYQVRPSGLGDFPFRVVFLEPDSNFDTYRILTIMLLIFALYFLVYQFIIEVLRLRGVNHYFDNIDFNIFNNLKEGIIIANKFGKVLFANKAVYEMFAEKNIVFRETDLRELTGPIDGPDRMTLQKSGDLLEIIRSPIVKEGKLLGSLVVISPSWEKEMLSEHALGGLVEMLPDGVLFVDKENKVVTFNLMASYYLGRLAKDIDIGEVNNELANLIENTIGTKASTRTALSWGDMQCELKPVYDENSLYTGAIVFLKTN